MENSQIKYWKLERDNFKGYDSLNAWWTAFVDNKIKELRR